MREQSTSPQEPDRKARVGTPLLRLTRILERSGSTANSLSVGQPSLIGPTGIKTHLQSSDCNDLTRQRRAGILARPYAFDATHCS